MNDYFKRQVNSGTFSLFRVFGQNRAAVSDYVGPLLQNGIAVLNMELPPNCAVGDELEFEAVVSDPVLLDDFINRFRLNVEAEVVPTPGEPGERRKPPSEHPGTEREHAAGITMPNIIPIYEKEWNNFDPPFDRYTAMRVGITDEQSANVPGDDGHHDVFDFKINMDNVFLKTELKNSKVDIQLLHRRWQYSMVLVGLALIHDHKQQQKESENADSRDGFEVPQLENEDGNAESIEDKVAKVTTALAPVLLPMIESLGTLDIEEAGTVSVSAEAS